MARKQLLKVLTHEQAGVLSVLGDSVAIGIMHDLSSPKRYSEIDLDVSSKTLSSRLKMLERQGFITRTPHPEVPPRVVYAKTAKGEELCSIVDGLVQWEHSWR